MDEHEVIVAVSVAQTRLGTLAELCDKGQFATHTRPAAFGPKMEHLLKMQLAHDIARTRREQSAFGVTSERLDRLSVTR